MCVNQKLYKTTLSTLKMSVISTAAQTSTFLFITPHDNSSTESSHLSRLRKHYKAEIN